MLCAAINNNAAVEYFLGFLKDIAKLLSESGLLIYITVLI